MTLGAQSWTPPCPHQVWGGGNGEAAPGHLCAAQHMLLNITSGTDAPRQGAVCATAPLRRKLRAPLKFEQPSGFGDTEQGQRQLLYLCRSLFPCKEERFPSFKPSRISRCLSREGKRVHAALPTCISPTKPNLSCFRPTNQSNPRCHGCDSPHAGSWAHHVPASPALAMISHQGGLRPFLEADEASAAHMASPWRGRIWGGPQGPMQAVSWVSCPGREDTHRRGRSTGLPIHGLPFAVCIQFSSS